MRLIVVTPTRLLGDGLAACFRVHPTVSPPRTVRDLKLLREELQSEVADVVLIDVTQGIDLDEVRAIALEHQDIAFVALGLQEQRQNVIRCGRAGFSGYVSRHASIDELYRALSDAVAGRLTCSAEISGGLLRALFRRETHAHAEEMKDALTRREGEVLTLIGRGLSNKEIARELELSLSTVKHHVHHVLTKLQLPRRAQAMRRVREAPWIATLSPGDPG
jgi:DNA-binding NarL/FixJ family response regulator